MRTDPECIFCRIAKGEIPSDHVFQSETVMAFRDIQPAAPTHILVIPREHIRSVDDLRSGDEVLLGDLILAARSIARSEGLTENGYRLVSNVGTWGGQSVDHLHVHILGGRQLGRLG